MKRAFIAALCLSIASVTASHAATANLALNATAQVSDYYNNNYLPEFAVDGDATTSWNAGSAASTDSPHFIELDLGATRVIGTIQGIVSQSPAGGTVHNIYLDDVLSFTWAQNTDNYDLLSYSFDDLQEARYVRFETTASLGWTAWNELRVFSDNTPAPVPVPASAVLLLSAISGFGLMKRRKGKTA